MARGRNKQQRFRASVHCLPSSGARRQGMLAEGDRMDKLRGSGNTFSTSGQLWQPFHYNPRLAKQKQRLHRLKRKGLTLPADKASARKLIEQACAEQPIHRIPQRKT
jgi:hypothetical protein